MPLRVILVEDDSDAAYILQHNLAKAGYEVQCLSEGSAIVERRFVLPDVFILDNGLPTIDGLALCKYLRLQRDLMHVPIVMVSGDHDIIGKAFRAGASAFLRKPFAPNDILNCLIRIGKYHHASSVQQSNYG